MRTKYCRAGALGTGFMAVVLGSAGVQAQVPGVSGLCADRADQVLEPVPIQAPLSTGSQVRPTGPAADLHCIGLLPTASVGRGLGMVELGRIVTPFGVAVSPQGHHRYALTAWLDDLPSPESLGPYSTYVAWAVSPSFDQSIRLGEVSNGRNVLGEVGMNVFIVMVSAEASADVPERQGRLVLRGRSPSSLMEAHDLLAQAPVALQSVPHDAMHSAWRMPPSYPGISMLPGMMGVRPKVAPFLPESPDSLPEAEPPAVVELPNGGTLDLEAGFVRKEIGGRALTMLAFNGQIPGPMIRVREASTIYVNFTNSSFMPTAVHWHGLRLDNRFDGVPSLTQDAVFPGETFRYEIHFPDAGIYWYHPHHREDVQQELGLYGNMLVDPLVDGYYGPVNREEVVMLDDLLLDDLGVVPFGRESANYMLMGRFGNTILVNGEPGYDLEVDRGEVVRFYLTNVANTRTFNVSFRQGERRLPFKVVASDVSRFEREEWAESAVLAPAERYVIEVQFDRSGKVDIVNEVQGIDHRQGRFRAEERLLGVVEVSEISAVEDHGATHSALREHEAVVEDIDRYRARFDDLPDHEITLSLRVPNLPPAIEQSMLYDWAYFNPVEWTGTMPMMNWATSGNEVRWLIRDEDTGKENLHIDWSFRVGDVVKIRVHNDRTAFHAMQHPLHIHGQRFLVVEQNGVPNDNLVWKDTVLLPAGSTTDLLLELSNPGKWMVHCHIAEHLESGMKFNFEVTR